MDKEKIARIDARNAASRKNFLEEQEKVEQAFPDISENQNVSKEEEDIEFAPVPQEDERKDLPVIES